MRKKSHIALTTYLLNQLKDSGMQEHKFSFYLGSILPDIKPSFIYKRHEYSGTIEDTKKKVEELLKMNITKKRHGRKYYRGLGEVSHYLADYFTFPHNTNYDEDMTAHIHYENALKHAIREHLKTIRHTPYNKIQLPSQKEIFDFVEKNHKNFLKKKSNVENDIQHIVEINRQAIAAIEDLRKKVKNR
ncbi:MAG: zinc dependent phospholipase C family protein [Lachnospiraceae bacterium]|nr:zinc dependent phospholipase C family protein [Lachnospiraceae bacterium]